MGATTILCVGQEAWRLLDDPGFCHEWKALADADRKHTWYQEPHFCGAWYRAYQKTSQPLLLLAKKGNSLRAIMPLARMEGGRLTHAGDHQCEYQGWIADIEYDQKFPLDCVRLLFERELYNRWAWRYVAPDAPIDWLSDISSSKLGRVAKTNTVAPLFDVRNDGFIRGRLKGNLKNRINGLRRRGMNYERVTCPGSLQEVVAKLAASYDLRSCWMRSSMPFANDPAKLDFYRELASDPAQVWVSVLNLENEMIAAHLGPRVGGELSINLISYAAREHRQSPGIILLAEMAADLSRHGGKTIDLTPGGESYKKKWETHHRSLDGFHLFRSRVAAAINSSSSFIRRTTIGRVRKLGVEPRALLNISGDRPATQKLDDRSIAIREFQFGMSIDDNPNTCGQVETQNNECVERLLLERARQLDLRAAHKLISASARLWLEGWRPLILGAKSEAPHILWMQPTRVESRQAERLADLAPATNLSDASIAWTFRSRKAGTMELTTSELNAIAESCHLATSRLLLVSEPIT